MSLAGRTTTKQTGQDLLVFSTLKRCYDESLLTVFNSGRVKASWSL